MRKIKTAAEHKAMSKWRSACKKAKRLGLPEPSKPDASQFS